MYCSRLLALQELLNDREIEKLEDYFSGLIGSACNNITVLKVAKAINISYTLASKVLTKCVQVNILSVSYAIRCPECNMLLKQVDSLAEIPQGFFECYSCNQEIEVTQNDIELLYQLTNSSGNFFIKGQQIEDSLTARTVVHENSMQSVFLAGGVNDYFFHPTDEQYQGLLELYSKVESRSGTTKKIGDTLENLVKKLFNLSPIFRAADIRTTTNQIDCCVRNKMYLNYGILNTIGARFFIECKNESNTPHGDYMSKLHSIISVANAGNKGECVKFGIIISRKKGPNTFRTLANKLYLAEGIVLIDICGEELKNLFQSKGNLLELIERKVAEIMMDSTTDLVEAGLYDV